MAVRGAITIECDMPECKAEFEFGAEMIREADSSLDELIWDEGWRDRIDHIICPQCIEEGK